jgi:hypothetical protein
MMFQMNGLQRNGVVKATGFLAVALVLSVPVGRARAGDKLNIIGQRTRVEPGKEKRSAEDVNASDHGLVLRPPAYGMSRPRPRPRIRDPKLEKRLQNKEIERENWVFLAPGELQAREDQRQNNFGVRDYSAGDVGKEKPVRDYTFEKLKKDQNSENASQSTGSSSGSQNRSNYKPESSQGRSDQDEGDVDLNPFHPPTTPAGQPEVGAHIASELNLKSLLDSGQTAGGASASSGDQDDLSWRSVLGRGGPLSASEDSQSMDNFRRLLNSQSAASTVPGLNDPVNRSPDLTRQALNPVIGSPAGPGFNTGRTLGDALKPISPASQPSGSPGLFATDPQRNLGPSRLSGFSSLPSPQLGPPVTPPERQLIVPTLEVPRRKL